jgi:hypothetical protein
LGDFTNREARTGVGKVRAAEMGLKGCFAEKVIIVNLL